MKVFEISYLDNDRIKRKFVSNLKKAYDLYHTKRKIIFKQAKSYSFVAKELKEKNYISLSLEYNTDFTIQKHEVE